MERTVRKLMLIGIVSVSVESQSCLRFRYQRGTVELNHIEIYFTTALFIFVGTWWNKHDSTDQI